MNSPNKFITWTVIVKVLANRACTYPTYYTEWLSGITNVKVTTEIALWTVDLDTKHFSVNMMSCTEVCGGEGSLAEWLWSLTTNH